MIVLGDGKQSQWFTEQSAYLNSYVQASIDTLPPAKRASVIAACRAAQLPADAEKELLFEVICLMDARPAETPAERDKALANVAETAAALIAALKDLGLRRLALIAVGHKLQKNRPELEKLMHGDTPPIPSDVQLIILVEAVARLRAEHGAGASGGRRKITHIHAKTIARIWEITRDYGLTAGRGGGFERLCNAIFEAAEVPANAEGAIRYFTKNLRDRPVNKMVPLFGLPDKTAP